MIRFVLRFIGLVSLALGFIFLVYDGTKSIADQVFYVTKLTDVWDWVYSRPAEAVLRPAIDKIFADFLWDPVVLPVLIAPFCLVLAIVGSILILLGRKKKPLIGYARD